MRRVTRPGTAAAPLPGGPARWDAWDTVHATTRVRKRPLRRPRRHVAKTVEPRVGGDTRVARWRRPGTNLRLINVGWSHARRARAAGACGGRPYKDRWGGTHVFLRKRGRSAVAVMVGSDSSASSSCLFFFAMAPLWVRVLRAIGTRYELARHVGPSQSLLCSRTCNSRPAQALWSLATVVHPSRCGSPRPGALG